MEVSEEKTVNTETIEPPTKKRKMSKNNEEKPDKNADKSNKLKKKQNVVIYWYNQDLLNNQDPNEDQEKKNDIVKVTELQNTLKNLKIEFAELQREFDTIKKTPTKKEIEEQLQQKKQEFE